MFIYEIDLVSPHFSRSSPQVSDDETSTETRQEGDNAQDLSEKIMAPWTFSIKFSYDTQFTFGSLIFVVEEDGNLELLTQGPPPKHSTLVYGQAPYLSFCQLIYVRRCILKSESLCRALPSRYQDHTGHGCAASQRSLYSMNPYQRRLSADRKTSSERI
jgi:hypothetical protein